MGIILYPIYLKLSHFDGICIQSTNNPGLYLRYTVGISCMMLIVALLHREGNVAMATEERLSLDAEGNVQWPYFIRSREPWKFRVTERRWSKVSSEACCCNKTAAVMILSWQPRTVNGLFLTAWANRVSVDTRVKADCILTLNQIHC